MIRKGINAKCSVHYIA